MKKEQKMFDMMMLGSQKRGDLGKIDAFIKKFEKQFQDIDLPEIVLANMTKEEFEAEKKSKKEESIVNFLKDNATIQNAVLENDILTLKDYKYNIQLEFVQFGEGKVTLEEAGISEAAIDYDWDKSLVKTLESMRGSLNVIPINKHIVFHNPATDQVLIARPC